MRRLIIILLALALALGACSTARQKLSPQANVNAKTAGVYYAQQNVDKAEEYYGKVLAEHQTTLFPAQNGRYQSLQSRTKPSYGSRIQ
jgi:uncharacterized protein YceK